MQSIKITSLVSIIILASFMIACEFSAGGSNPTYSAEPDLPKVSLYQELAALTHVRDTMTKQVIESGVNPQELCETLISGDFARAGEIMGLSKEREAELSARLDAAVAGIFSKRPDLAPIEGPALESCDITYFFQHMYPDLLQAHAFESGLGKIADDACDSNVTCDYDSYTFGLINCAASGPYLYWMCAYFVLCQYCTGGWINSIC
jgi:hypothetical protein